MAARRVGVGQSILQYQTNEDNNRRAPQAESLIWACMARIIRALENDGSTQRCTNRKVHGGGLGSGRARHAYDLGVQDTPTPEDVQM